MEVDDVLVMLAEDVLAIDGGVVVGEEAIHVFAVLVGDAVELVRFYLFEMADYLWRDGEGGFAVKTRIEELESAFVQNVFMLGKVEIRVDADALEHPPLLSHVLVEDNVSASVLRHHRRIHTTHAGARNHIGSQVGG